MQGYRHGSSTRIFSNCEQVRARNCSGALEASHAESKVPYLRPDQVACFFIQEHFVAPPQKRSIHTNF